MPSEKPQQASPQVMPIVETDQATRGVKLSAKYADLLPRKSKEPVPKKSSGSWHYDEIEVELRSSKMTVEVNLYIVKGTKASSF